MGRTCTGIHQLGTVGGFGCYGNKHRRQLSDLLVAYNIGAVEKMDYYYYFYDLTLNLLRELITVKPSPHDFEVMQLNRR